VAAHLIAATPTPTFERFTDRARHVVAAARQAARAAGDDAVSSQHILIGLFAEPAGLGCRALTNLRVSEADVRAAASAGTQPGKDASETPPQFADDGKQALAAALTIALELGHNYIGTEHMLLGLYRNAESRAAQILTDLGTSEATAKAEIMEMLRDFQQRS
jgi:ATP-dependent Clp protease ATP-binding subunit ClpA